MFTMKTTSPELWEPMQETLLELESANQKVLFTCTSSQGFAAEVLAAVRMCLPGADGSLDRALNKASRTADGRVHVVMVVGTPNVGKTSLVNALRRHARTHGLLDVPRTGQLPVGPLPGVTKHVAGIKVGHSSHTSRTSSCCMRAVHQGLAYMLLFVFSEQRPQPLQCSLSEDSLLNMLYWPYYSLRPLRNGAGCRQSDNAAH